MVDNVILTLAVGAEPLVVSVIRKPPAGREMAAADHEAEAELLWDLIRSRISIGTTDRLFDKWFAFRADQAAVQSRLQNTKTEDRQ